MFLAERTVSTTVLRRGRALCVGGRGESSRQGIVSGKERQNKANDVGKGHIVQGFVGLVFSCFLQDKNTKTGTILAFNP